MYTGLHDPGRWSLPAVLAEQAARRPDLEWITTTDGERLSFSAAHADARRVAGFLAAQGVEPGDRVAVLLPNGVDFARAWMGLGFLGATAVLLNTELRGAFLRHQLDNCGARLAIVDAALLGALDELEGRPGQLERLVIAGEGASGGAGFERAGWEGWRGAPPREGAPPAPHEIAAVMYTSGTSGPAKGVLMPHAHCYLYGLGAIEAVALRPDDVYYIVLPLFHANGLLMQLGATLIAGARAIVRPRFSATAWLDDVRAHGATVTNGLGVVPAYVTAQPPTPHDRDHRLRAMLNAPNAPAHEAILRERFGIRDVVSGFGMTECNIPIWGRLGQSRPGAAGWVYQRHFEVMIADPETDRPVPAGAIGEILVRPKTAWGFMAGYLDLPDKTVEAWRNLWFHTGDAATMDAEGVVTFVDRLKDCIRRRSENISAAEVEAVVAELPGVKEVAAYAVPSDVPGGEDEVMLAIVPAEAPERFDPAALVAQADARLPRFAQPRFVELVSELPKTATGKVQRAVLRKRGASRAWDRNR